MKHVIIIVIAFVLLIPASAFGSWHWSSDVEICGDKICDEKSLIINPKSLIYMRDNVYLLIFEGCSGSEPISTDEVEIISDTETLLLAQHAERGRVIESEECVVLEVQIQAEDPSSIIFISERFGISQSIDPKELEKDALSYDRVDLHMGFPNQITIRTSNLSHSNEPLTHEQIQECENAHNDFTTLTSGEFGARYLYHNFVGDCIILFEDPIWETKGDDRYKILGQRLTEIKQSLKEQEEMLSTPITIKPLSTIEIEQGLYLYTFEGCTGSHSVNVDDYVIASDTEVFSLVTEKRKGNIIPPGFCRILDIKIRADDPDSIRVMIPSMAMENSMDRPMGNHSMMNGMGNNHMAYHGMCAPGFASLDGMCVLDDRCGPGAYPGRMCVMDGEMKQYLRPNPQKFAGISVDNIICIEGKDVMFKHDATPACVNSDSVESLKHRGWSSEKPSITCTAEYSPVCGVDGITYGNMCGLDVQHMAMNYPGECVVSSLITNFEQCIAAGNPAMESHPRQCRTSDGQHFVEEIKIQETGVFLESIKYTKNAPIIDEQKGYFVDEIADGIYWLVGSGYQVMFLTTGEEVIVIDAPQPIGEKYLQAIKEVTDEPITHMIYSHPHADHTGAAGQIFPSDIEYIAHQDTADILISENDPNRPIPTITFDDTYTLSMGNQVLELYYIGAFHSEGDIVILAPKQKVAMAVDLFHPDAAPYKAFGVTVNLDTHIEAHDTLVNDFDFDVLISGHEQILGTKDHIKTDKEFVLSMMEITTQAIQSVSSDEVIPRCVDNTLEQWQGKLHNLEQYMVEHCTAMQKYVSSQ